MYVPQSTGKGQRVGGFDSPLFHVGSDEPTQVFRLGGKCPYPPSHLPSPRVILPFTSLTDQQEDLMSEADSLSGHSFDSLKQPVASVWRVLRALCWEYGCSEEEDVVMTVKCSLSRKETWPETC